MKSSRASKDGAGLKVSPVLYDTINIGQMQMFFQLSALVTRLSVAGELLQSRILLREKNADTRIPRPGTGGELSQRQYYQKGL